MIWVDFSSDCINTVIVGFRLVCHLIPIDVSLLKHLDSLSLALAKQFIYCHQI